MKLTELTIEQIQDEIKNLYTLKLRGFNWGVNSNTELIQLTTIRLENNFINYTEIAIDNLINLLKYELQTRTA